MSADDEELAKDRGPLAALTIGVGTMIGAGIFVLPGTAIARAGSFAIGSFVIGGAIALLTALSPSELGTAMPGSGGAYYYVSRALGPLSARSRGGLTGWDWPSPRRFTRSGSASTSGRSSGSRLPTPAPETPRREPDGLWVAVGPTLLARRWTM